jgi:isopentenyl-diphosphate Delta-isomerase
MRMQTTQSTQTVVLVDERGEVLGHAEKLDAHQPPGQLHLAFSVLLYRDDGALLLQQRAAGKYHFPLNWANACCSHHREDEDLLVAATSRLKEELGISAELEWAGSFVYRASCPVTGLVEYEFDHVLIGINSTEPRPDPREVAATCFVQPGALLDGTFPGVLAPWLLPALEIAERRRSLPSS